MPSATTATAIIQFIGIIMFTRELAPDHQLQAVMPRILGHTPPAARAVMVAETGPVSVVRPDIEEHAAFIAFPASAYLSSTNWAPTGLETTRGYLFVRLDGEHVTFTTDAVEDKPEDKTKRTKAAQRIEEPRIVEPGLKLPHMQQCCGGTLKSEFQYPDYPGAVAVFDIPYKKVNGCQANAKDVKRSRSDTQLQIDNGGILVITATKNGQTKKIQLDGNAIVVVGHLPTDVLGGPLHAGSMSHQLAYVDMIDEEGTCGEGCPLNLVEKLAECRESVMRTPNGPSTPHPWARFDLECSNTQWP